MKIAVFSDCHLEFHMDGGASFLRSLPKADVAVVAGDLSILSSIPAPLRVLCSMYGHVVYVSGNHELYGFFPDQLKEQRRLAQKAHPNLRWLDNSSAEIGGVRFVGSTLWFPEPPPEADKSCLNDYRQIAEFEPWVYEEHARSVEFLDRELQPSDVLVTHHFPFYTSIDKRFAGSSLNPFFHAGPGAEELVASRQPRLAIHGHTHTTFDYEVGGIRVVCNPLGYPGENPWFDYRKTVEVQPSSPRGEGLE